MALLDHFRPPLSDRRHGHSFHNSWATYLSSALNAHLPAGYFAEANVQYGIEIDVAAFEDGDTEPNAAPGWVPRPPDLSVPVTLAEAVVEVGVFSRSGGPLLSRTPTPAECGGVLHLAAAIELVSPTNKDRPATRDALVSQCTAYIHAGVGVVIVDVVTDRSADLHGELLARLGADAGGAGSSLFAAAYRPVERGGAATLDVWREPLSVGRALPTLPLWLRGGPCLPVELQSTYERTCREQRVPAAA